jgi:D-beta-D-heptose 7-phosphate kinase/D-beta-D-heptose 1-phosphate adenosyltransferase
LKGSGRPIIAEAERRETLLALRCVNHVIIFEEDTPLELLYIVRPQILVKGPDYHGRTVTGQQFVESLGGRVMTPDWPITISTSDIIDRIRNCR